MGLTVTIDMDREEVRSSDGYSCGISPPNRRQVFEIFEPVFETYVIKCDGTSFFAETWTEAKEWVEMLL